MPVTYKDIDLLTQKSSVAGTEKLPVSDTQYITPEQIVAKEPAAAWFNPANTTMYFFASDADKNAFITDQTQTSKVLFSVFIALSIHQVVVSDTTGSTTITETEDKTTILLAVSFALQEKPIVGGTWQDIAGGLDLSVLVDSGDTGTFTTVDTEHFTTNTTYSINIRQYIVLGTNTAKIRCAYSEDASVYGEVTYSIALSTEPYITFVDSQVGSICATNWGDGVGITAGQAARVTNISTTFTSNTSITSFNELSYFTGINTIPGTNGSDGAFQGCTSLTSVTIPSSVTSLGRAAFKGCSSLSSISVPSTVTSIGRECFSDCSALVTAVVPVVDGLNTFNHCTSLSLVTVNGNVGSASTPFNDAGKTDGSGKLVVTGSWSAGGNGYMNFGTVEIGGDVYSTGTGHAFGRSSQTSYDFVLRIAGSLTPNTSAQYIYNEDVVFFEVMGQIVTQGGYLFNTIKDGCIWHLGYNGVAPYAYVTRGGNSAIKARVSKIYVDSQATLDAYIADTNWSGWSDKFDLWSNYSGSYKTT